MKYGIESIGPGRKCSEIDQIVRSRIQDYGFDYPHRSGHGIGVTNFELPYLMPFNDEDIVEGMTLTTEPGIYAPGIGR